MDMMAWKFGGDLLDLDDQLEASRYLARADQLWSDAELERVHVWLELMLLENAK